MSSSNELLRSQRRDAIRSSAMFMAVALYSAVLVYTGVHSYNLISRTVTADRQPSAVIALLCLEGMMIFLPIAIQFRLTPGWRRMAGYVLYGLSFAIVITNTVLDAISSRIGVLPEWLWLYATVVMAAVPIMAAAAFAVVLASPQEGRSNGGQS